MKKLIFLLLILSISVLAEPNLYQQDSLELILDINGAFDLISTGSSPTVKDVSTELFLFPDNNFRQQVLEVDTTGTQQQDTVTFTWNDNKIGNKQFGYSSLIRTTNIQNIVTEKIQFPIPKSKIKNYLQYLEPTITIDSANPKVIQKATELVEGEDDLFRAAFNLASWVESNVKYDLNTLTAQASQKASWVLDNREGVCDEMTSLFVAMARAVGIPARFASGISYTTSDLFDKNWQPHGWAEVYFPDVGWVSFDITFGEYGYIDVTHIKLRDGFDPAEPATKYQWLSNNVQLQSTPLNLDVTIKKQGKQVSENIKITEDLLSSEVGFGSYNVVKGIIKNTANYYTATTLKLAVPPEVEIQGRNQRTILLPPLERRETLWIVKIPDNLDQKFIYTFPAMIYSERNSTDIKTITAKRGGKVYTKQETLRFADQDEEKTFSSALSLECTYPLEVGLNEEISITCNVHNQGNTNLKNVTFCIEDKCKTTDIRINQLEQQQLTIQNKQIGWQKILASAETSELQKKKSIEYQVLDKPGIIAEIIGPDFLQFGQSLVIQINLQKKSFAEPKNVEIQLKGPGFIQQWELSNLPNQKELNLELKDFPLQSKNKFTLEVTWDDSYSLEQSLTINGKGNSFSEKIKMLFNRISNLFRK